MLKASIENPLKLLKVTQLEPHLEEDVNGVHGHDLEDVVGPGQDGLEPELDNWTY